MRAAATAFLLFRLAGLTGLVLLGARPALGRELLAGDALALRTTLKSTLLLSRYADDPLLFPERVAADGLFRLRLDLLAKPSESLAAEAAWETRLRATAPPGAAGASFLPAEAAPAWRLRAFDASIARAEGLAWRHELDRAALAWRPGLGDVTVGRQAIGWGRGVLFGAVDLFAPFSPLEADRAWRRGVDAARADLRLSERLSLEAVAALGQDGAADRSTFAARIRGYADDLDAELLLGRRARDLLVGAAASAAVGDAEVHGELAAFHTPDPVRAPLTGDDRLVGKAVLGGSYRFPVGAGLPVFVEYHYSGFGAARRSDLPALLADPGFTARLARGDTQLLFRHAVALLATWEANEEVNLQLLWLASPRDGSGVLSPSATFTVGDKASVQATGWIPHGAPPRGGALGSEHGATPLAFLVQVAIHD